MKIIFTGVVVLMLLSACDRFANEDRKNNQPSGVVCLSKQYNEIIYALGAQQNIVAVDISSTFPPEIKKLPTVGYHRALSAEAILAMKPDLIIHDNNIGPEHVTRQLADLQIPMKVFGKYKDDIAGTDSLIREMGKHFNKAPEAETICNKLDADIAKALALSSEFTERPRVLVIHYGQASNVYLLMSQKSTASKMINWAGGDLVVLDEKGMKQYSAEAVAAADPDIILLTDFGYDRLGSTEKVKELPGISATRAAMNDRIYRVEEHDLVYIGPRTGENVMMLQKLIHENAPAQ